MRARDGCWGLGAWALLQLHSDGRVESVGREKEKERDGEEGLLVTEERRGMRTRAIAAIVWCGGFWWVSLFWREGFCWGFGGFRGFDV